MTTTATPNAQAWLAKEATSLGPFIVRLGGGRTGFTALARGHWVVVVDTAGALKRVMYEKSIDAFQAACRR